MSANQTTEPAQRLAEAFAKATRVTLVDGGHRSMELIHEALLAAGYQVRLFDRPNDALAQAHLSNNTDILLLDAKVARQPRSSQFVDVPAIVVLTETAADPLPPWLEASHVFIVPYPDNPNDLVEHLSDYGSPRVSNFDVGATDTESLALLFGITQFLSGHLDINDLFERILTLAPYLDAEFAALLVQEGDEIIYYRSTQPGREELVGPAGRRFARRLIKDGIEGWVLRHDEVVVLPNTGRDPRWFSASYTPVQEHCVVALPINLERVEARGVYLIGHQEPEHFSQSNIPLLRAAITQIRLAIENAMLFKNQSQRSIQLALINEVSQAATSILNLDVMLRTVVQAIRRSFACHSVAIYLLNRSANRVELQARATSKRYWSSTSRQIRRNTNVSLRQGLIGWSAASNETVLANDVTQHPRYVMDSYDKEVRAELCVPIALGVKTIGILDLQSTQIEAFDKYHVAALETLADQLAIAIENARLYDTINQHIEELQSLYEIGQAITSTLDLQKTLTLVTDQTTRLMGVAAASVVLRDDENEEVWFAAASGEGSDAVLGVRMPLGQGIAGWVAANGEAVIIPDVYADNRFFAEVDQKSGFVTESIVCVPLQTKGHTIGAVEVMNKKDGRFDQEDLATLQALAIPAATAIENAQLYQKQIQTIKRLAETQSQLVQSAKLAAVGELAAGIAHEINNPLTTIIGLTSLLLEEPVSNALQSEAVEDLQMVNEEAQRARDIVRSLLNFARADTPKRQPVDLNQLIDEAVFLVYTKRVGQKVALEQSLSPLPEMFLDINQIKQVIVNLLNNAVQAMLDNDDRPAKLSITTRLASIPPAEPAADGSGLAETTGPNSKSNQVVVCQIADTGHGIEPEHLDKVFDPFFTTKEVGTGTGLGLSISYGIVEKHGGTITVESTPGQGSTFSLTLPLSSGPLSEPTSSADYAGASVLPRVFGND